MCGRYYRKSDKQKIAEAFHVTKVDDFPLPPWDYNVAPPLRSNPSSETTATPASASLSRCAGVWCRFSLKTSRR
jgi:hypothetical protein